MKKFLVLSSAFLLVFGLAGVAGATFINLGGTSDVNDSLTSSVPGVTVETFDSGGISPPGGLTQSWNWTGDFKIVHSPSVTDQYATPFNPDKSAADKTNFVGVGTGGGSGSVSVNLDPGKTGVKYNYFGIWWGSVDLYNSLSFQDGASTVYTVTITGFSPGTGDQMSSSTNNYVNFFDLPPFNGFTMDSTSPAFEADNIAVANLRVPEPATMLLLGAGLLGIWVYARRRFKK